MANVNKQVRAFCNMCHGDTNHSLLYNNIGKVDEPEGDFVRSLEISWEILRCCGCDDIKLRHSLRFLDSSQPRISYYPPMEIRRLPEWSHGHLPDKVKGLQQEVHSAINANNRRLAAMGARILIDMAILASVGDRGTFKEKLDAMVDEGCLAPKNSEFLYAALDTGNAASHQGHNPSPEDIDKVMEIVEHLLKGIFYLRKLGQELKQTAPRRIRTQKGGN